MDQIKTPITQEQFQAVIDLVSSGVGIYKACTQVGISTRSYYIMKRADDDNEKRHADAKEARSEIIAQEIIDLTDENIKEVKTAAPGTASALQRAYETKINSLNSILTKLNPNEYGNKIDLSDSSMKIVMVNQNQVNT